MSLPLSVTMKLGPMSPPPPWESPRAMPYMTRRSLFAALCASLPGLAFGQKLLSRLPTEMDLGGTPRKVPAGQQASTSTAKPVPPVEGRQVPYWFTDVAGRSSFNYRSNNDFTGRKYFPQPMCGGVAAIDYNNDGRMDLFRSE